jgi:hypothetical protein
MRDDGSLATRFRSPADEQAAAETIIANFIDTGTEMPDVISVWTTFVMDGSALETLFAPMANDVDGIGLQTQYGSPATFASSTPPLRSILLHNNVLAMPQRATRHQAPLDGYAQYLFLLELSHNWGPAIQLPGTSPGALIGFPFHWSFWMDAGGSPAGGNAWHDNGDGTFTVSGQAPATVEYSMLDLYAMGLADASEVQPFAVLENPVAPVGTPDPVNGGTVSAMTFPWFGPQSLTVHATRHPYTIDDVIAANGTRAPSRAASPSQFKLGIVLMVGANDTDEQIAQAQAVFDPIASSLAPAFHRATRMRGTMNVVTESPDPPAPDAGVDTDAGDPNDGSTPVNPTHGCNIGRTDGANGELGFALMALGLMMVRRTRRRVARTSE